MPNPRPADLPDFENPPVVETVFSLQFASLAGWTSAHAGKLWERLGIRFSTVEEYPPLAHTIEWLGPPRPPEVQLAVEDHPPANRLWLLSSAKDQLLQVQSDRLVLNWRSLDGATRYPRYEVLRRAFTDDANLFSAFVAECGFGPLVFDQCELTYINHVSLGGAGHANGVERVITGPLSWPAGGFLPKQSDEGFTARFIIAAPGEPGRPAGRLHLSAQPAWRRTDSAPILIVTLAARGAPLGAGIEGAFRFFDLARDWIVRGFKDVTTPEMHREWGLING